MFNRTIYKTPNETVKIDYTRQITAFLRRSTETYKYINNQFRPYGSPLPPLSIV